MYLTLYVIIFLSNVTSNSYEDVCVNGKASPGQALTGPDRPLTGPEGSRNLRLPDFKTIGT
jgi:hypothetical protein